MKRSINTDDKSYLRILSSKIGDRVYPIVLIVALILLWHISVTVGWVEAFVLPYPWDVVKTLYEIRMDLLEHLLVTMQEALYGLVIAVVFSVVTAFLMDSVLVVKKALFPILLISQMVPVILLAPLFSMWFGFTMTPKIIVVVLVCFFPIVVSLSESLEAVDLDEIDLLLSMGASSYQVFRIVKLPSAMIGFFSGLKVAATYSFMGAVISEWMGGVKGLGIYYLRAKKNFDINRVFAVVLVIIIMSMLIYGFVAKLQQITTPFIKKGE